MKQVACHLFQCKPQYFCTSIDKVYEICMTYTAILMYIDVRVWWVVGGMVGWVIIQQCMEPCHAVTHVLLVFSYTHILVGIMSLACYTGIQMLLAHITYDRMTHESCTSCYWNSISVSRRTFGVAWLVITHAALVVVPAGCSRRTFHNSVGGFEIDMRQVLGAQVHVLRRWKQQECLSS